MKQLRFVFFVWWLCSLQEVAGQGLSNKGKEFWVGYGHNYYMEQAGSTTYNSQDMVLYLSADQPANVTVSINGTTWTRTYVIPANTVIATEALPKSGTNDCRLWSLPPSYGGSNSEGVFNRGIHIVSDVPIVAYAHIYASASSGATMLLPVETWGYNYTSVNYRQSPVPDCYSWVNVIANHDDTRIQITPSILTRGGSPAGVPVTVTLNKGQVYQILSSPAAPASTGYDLTGTTVKSVANSSGACYPIAVLSGSSLTYMNFNCGGPSGDSYIQQVFPAQAWGRSYLTAPTSASTAANALMLNAYRVVVKDPTTIVRRNGIVMSGLVANTYYEYYSSTADYITADKPILVAQYMGSQGSCYPGVGDPEMIYISPVEQAIKKIGFYRNNRYSIDVNYLTLIIPTAGLSSLLIDGNNSYDYSYPHPALAGYSVVVKKWNSAAIQCQVSADSAFTAITYGLGTYESYGYNAGTYINNLNAIGQIKNVYDTSITPNAYTCKNTPFTPSILIAYHPDKLVWEFSQTTGISPSTDITQLAPVAADTELINGNTYYRYRLSQSYQFSDTGNFLIKVLSTNAVVDNCNNTEELSIPVVVKPAPVASFVFSNSPTANLYTGCTLDTVYFTGTATPVPGGLPVNRYRWSFSGNPADTAIGATCKKQFATGGYPVTLRAITTEGCLDDTLQNLVIYPRPTAAMTVSPVTGCAPAIITATSSSSYAGPSPIINWHWEDGSQVQNNTSNAPASFSYPNAGSYTIQHTVKVSDLCISDTAIQTIQVYTKPVASFTYTQECAGVTQFTSTSATPIGQNLTYSWDFGDPASGANASAQANPSHQYTGYGTYLAKLAVVSQGCASDTASENIMLSAMPVANFTLPPAVCMPAGKAQFTNTSTIAGGGVLSYTWDFGDQSAKVSTTDPLHIYSAYGPYTITLVAANAAGCKDTATQTLTAFYDQPVAKFTTSNTVCQGTTNTFHDASTANNSTITKWNWAFGDGSSATSQNPVKAYATPGSYTVALAVQSQQGCLSDTAHQTVTVYLQPQISAGPSFIVQDGTVIQFAATANDTTHVKFLWTPGTDLSNDTILNPTLVAHNDQTYTLTATGDGNCTATDVLTVKILKFIQAPNVFSPNGDGINDTWVITNLSDYTHATVDVYDRNGGIVFHSTGYNQPWDGTIHGKALPVGTYYYIINLKNGSNPLSGPVTILR